jgi:hypothetical protein
MARLTLTLTWLPAPEVAISQLGLRQSHHDDESCRHSQLIPTEAQTCLDLCLQVGGPQLFSEMYLGFGGSGRHYLRKMHEAVSDSGSAP